MSAARPFEVRRLGGNPILHRDTTPGVGRNINGPSLVAAPPWVDEPLGRYYLYFAHHRGTFIRLATADAIEGPWRVYEPGTLSLAESHFPTGGRRPHIASPDVHVDPETQTVRMYFHGLDTETRVQHTRVALSRDGVHFETRPELLGRPYFRVFRHDGWWYALAMPGILYRSADGLTGFERGPRLFDRDMRHSALLRRGDELHVFWSRVGDQPERILSSPVRLDGDWTTWKAGPPVEVVEPQEAWEGAGLPAEPSERGWVDEPVCQLRDPAVFEDGSRTYLLYSVAGESGIAVAELTGLPAVAPLRRRLERVDPGGARLREAAVTMAATLVSFAASLLLEHVAHLSVTVVVLAVALSISAGRIGQRAEHRSRGSWGLSAAIVPLVALGANEIGTKMFEHPDLGDTLFVLAVSATIWVRRFGPLAKRVASLATLPLIAMLVVPAPVIALHGSGGSSRWWTALVAAIALAAVTVVRSAAERLGVLPPVPPAPETPAAPPSSRRVLASTKMALQMGIALGAAFAVGRAAFGSHWTWTVLTAFIVCSGNRGRGDVLHKATMRLAGAGAGTLAATALTGAFPAGDHWAVVAIFAVLAVALWLRPVNYGYWAAGMTAALALLYGYYGERGSGLLATRLEAILAGAVLGVAASWLVLPVRTTDVVRRDIGRALAALDGYLARPDPATEEAFVHAVAALDHAARLLRLLPAPLRSRVDHLPAIEGLARVAAALPRTTTAAAAGRAPAADEARAQIGGLRRANGQALLPDPKAWDGLASTVEALARGRTPAVAAGVPAPGPDRLRDSTEKVLAFVNRTHSLSYELLDHLARDGPSSTYALRDAAGRGATLTWSRDAGGPVPPSSSIAGRTPSGFPYTVEEQPLSNPGHGASGSGAPGNFGAAREER